MAEHSSSRGKLCSVTLTWCKVIKFLELIMLDNKLSSG
jgi:hypothetical protein